MKIVSSGKGLYSSEFYEKKQKSKRIKLIVYCSSFIVFLIVLVLFFRWDKFLINEIVVSDEIVINREEVAESVREELFGYYFYLIPKNNAFLYRRGALKASLIQEFPRFRSLNLNLEGFKKLIISADEREGYALYCTEYSSEVENVDCFFVDKEGLIFRKAPSFSYGVYFAYTLTPSLTEHLGQVLMETNEFKSLSQFIEGLPVLGIHASAIEIGNSGYELMLNKGGKILWKRDADLSRIYTNLESFLSDESIKSQKDFLDRIDHLDLRTEDKVFWKLKE